MEKYTKDPNKDEKGLIKAIKETSDREIRAIREKAEEETRRLRENAESDIENLKRKIEQETEQKIEHEISKIKNRALIEKNKLKLGNIEDYISAMTEETVNDLRVNNREKYIPFLVDTIAEAVLKIYGEGKTAEEIPVFISEKDAGIEKLKDAVYEKTGNSAGISIMIDNDIRKGGAIAVDEERGIYYNSTIDRIVFRKYEQIRKEVASILAEKGSS